MKKSNYTKFVDSFINRLEKQYDLRKDELTVFEILNITFLDYRDFVKFRVILLTFFLIISNAIFFFYFSFIAIILIALIFFTILYVLSFQFVSDAPHFNRLESRIKLIEKEYSSASGLHVSCIINLLKSYDPFELVGEELAKAYFNFKDRKYKNNKECSYHQTERLMLFYILLNAGFEFKTNNNEFNHIVGGFLNITPNQLGSEYLTNLNQLNYYMNNIPGKLKQNQVNDVRDKLKKLKEIVDRDLDVLFSSIINQSYENSVFVKEK